MLLASFSSTMPYQPLNSSPLANLSSGPSTPMTSTRRQAQFKARVPSTPVRSSSRNVKHPRARMPSSDSGSVFYESGSSSSRTWVSGAGTGIFNVDETPQKSFLRDKFKARCLERAAKARAKAIRGKRYANLGPSSDGFDEAMDDDDEDDDDDDIMQDELFRRIMEHASRKHRHSYRVSYADEVGSSFDPDIENIEEWEHDLSGHDLSQIDLEQLSDEELEAYAEECEKRAILEEFEDIPPDELFSLSDVEDLVETPHIVSEGDGDVEMIVH